MLCFPTIVGVGGGGFASSSDGGCVHSGAAYSLLEHNCNHFSEEVAQFVCGARVPKHILAQPDALPPPLRAALAAALGALAPAGPARRDSPDYDALNSQIEEARCDALTAAGVLFHTKENEHMYPKET